MRYASLWLSFFKISWMADFEYRLNVIVRVIAEFAWYAVQLSVFEVLYTHTETISGWDVNAMRVFMGTLFLTDVIYMILFMENIDNMATLVKKGDLDLYLTKPIASQFMVSCRKVAVAYFLNLVCILAYLIWAVSAFSAKNAAEVTGYQILSYIFAVGAGLVILYSLRFLFCILSVIMQDAGNIQFVWYQLYRMATRPDPIYPMLMRWFVLTLFPVAFFASVPSRILVEGMDPKLLVAAPCLAVFTLWLSHFLWNKALRHYSSASS